jgi:hypothetical protein
MCTAPKPTPFANPAAVRAPFTVNLADFVNKKSRAHLSWQLNVPVKEALRLNGLKIASSQRGLKT